MRYQSLAELAIDLPVAPDLARFGIGSRGDSARASADFKKFARLARGLLAGIIPGMAPVVAMIGARYLPFGNRMAAAWHVDRRAETPECAARLFAGEWLPEREGIVAAKALLERLI